MGQPEMVMIDFIKIGEKQMEMVKPNGIIRKWKEQGLCSVSQRGDDPMWRFVLIRILGTPNQKSAMQILDDLERMQEKLGEEQFPIALHILIPDNCTGYVIGRGGRTINQMKEKWNIRAFASKTPLREEDPQIRQGFQRIMLQGNSVENVRGGHEDIVELVRRAMDASPDMAAAANHRNGPAKQNNRNKEEEGEEEKMEWPNRRREVRFMEEKSNSVRFRQNSLEDGEEMAQMAERGDRERARSQPSRQLNPLGGGPARAGKNDGGIGEKMEGGGGGPPPIVPGQKQLPKKAEEFILIPALLLPSLMANRCQKLKDMEGRFNVRMQMMGENCMSYPNGRTLKIWGVSEEMVKKAKEFVDVQHIQPRHYALETGQRTFVSNSGENEQRLVDVPSELVNREDAEKYMLEMKERSGIDEYAYRQNKAYGMETVVLRGKKEAVDRAESRLKMMAQELMAPPTATNLGGGGIRSLFSLAESDNTLEAYAPHQKENVPPQTRNAKEQQSPPKMANEGKLRKDEEEMCSSIFTLEEATQSKTKMAAKSSPNKQTAAAADLPDLHSPAAPSNRKATAEMVAMMEEHRSEMAKMKKQLELKDAQIVRLEEEKNKLMMMMGRKEDNNNEEGSIFANMLPCGHLCQKCVAKWDKKHF